MAESAPDQIPAWQLYVIMVLMLIFGTCNTQVLKSQDDFVVYPNNKGDDQKYNHPFFQCFNMFVGELSCLLAYVIKKTFCKPKRSKTSDDNIPMSPGAQQANEVQLSTKVNPFLFAIPAAFDLCGSTLMFIGLTMCAASIYQMMRGMIVVITAAMAVIFLGRKQYLHHYLSILCIISAVGIVGITGILSSKDGDSTGDGETKLLGVILIIVAQLFTGGQFVTEEKLLAGKYIDPLLCVGLEGMWGCIYYAIILPIFQHISCDPNSQICHKSFATNPPKGVMEDSTEAWNALMNNWQLLLMSLGIVVSIACFNATGVAITKFASASQRSTIDTSRTLVIWLLNLALGNEKFNFGQMIGFILLVFGTLVYNEILILPIECLNRNTKREQFKREGGTVGMLDSVQNNDYIASSPTGLKYDNNRNLRNIEAARANGKDRQSLLDQHGNKNSNVYMNYDD